LVQRLLDAREDLLLGAPVAFWIAREPVEGAERAFDDADVGVVDVAVDDEGGVALGIAPAPDGIGRLANALEIAVLQQIERLRPGQARSGKYAGEHIALEPGIGRRRERVRHSGRSR